WTLSRARPPLAGPPDRETQLRSLLVGAEVVALHGGGEAALRRETELVEIHVLRRLLDPALELVLGLQLAALGRDEAEHDDLVLGDEAQRLEATGARVVP